ncbi:MAG: hypothetical protein N3D84_02565 [Candidatus Woesearchaeota archaeon]|nr:hypothetical protein [Candidatus Woesearchaeota archaeon]
MIASIFFIVPGKPQNKGKSASESARERQVFNPKTGKYETIKVETKAPYEKPFVSKIEYEKIAKSYEGPKREIAKKTRLSLTERIKGAIGNIKNIATNAFDNTVGYGIAKYQNWQTKRYFKANPDANTQIVYMMHGVDQNIGSQWRLAKTVHKQGKRAYHLKGHHSLPIEENVNKAFKQIEDFHRHTKLKNIDLRNDLYTGHSSGGNVGLYMATDPRVTKYGISHVQARAPTPTGFKAKTLPQRLIKLVANTAPEDITKEEGRRNVIKLHKRGEPYVPVHIVAGKYDRLVPPEITLYKHAKGIHVLEHPDSTHFGTSGVNDEINKVLLDILNYHSEKKYKKAA